MKTLFSGIQPYGELHRGNAPGAGRNRVEPGNTIPLSTSDEQLCRARACAATDAARVTRRAATLANSDLMSDISARGATRACATPSRTMAEGHGKLESWQ